MTADECAGSGYMLDPDDVFDGQLTASHDYRCADCGHLVPLAAAAEGLVLVDHDTDGQVTP